MAIDARPASPHTSCRLQDNDQSDMSRGDKRYEQLCLDVVSRLTITPNVYVLLIEVSAPPTEVVVAL